MNGVSKITITDNVSLVCFENMATDGRAMFKLLSELAKYEISIDMISQSAPYGNSISFGFTISDDELVSTLKICNELSKEYDGLKPMVSSSNCKIQLYGEDMPDTPGVAASAFGVIFETGAQLQLITTSEVDISCLISGVHVDETIDALKQHFGL